MLVAVFYEYGETQDGSADAREVGRIWFDGKLRHSGFKGRLRLNGTSLARFLKQIISGTAQLGDRIYTAADGEAFVRALPAEFDGTYFWARLEPEEAMVALREELFAWRDAGVKKEDTP